MCGKASEISKKSTLVVCKKKLLDEKNTHVCNENFCMQGTLNAEPLKEFHTQTVRFKLTLIEMTTAPKYATRTRKL